MNGVMNSHRASTVVTLLLGLCLPVAGMAAEDHGDHDMSGMQGMDMGSMQHAVKAPAAAPSTSAPGTADMQGMQHDTEPASHAMADMPGMSMGSTGTKSRSPDYSDGIDMSGHQAHMMGNRPLFMLLVDQLEYVHNDDGQAGALDAQAWWGGDVDKLWLKADGEVASGAVQDLRVEALWDHAFAPFWDTQLGIRHDAGEGPERNWLAFGVQGLAPYFFDIEATAYVGNAGRVAARFEAEYDLLLTQRLILTPDFEVNLYGKADPARGLGTGVTSSELGLRLRYEIRREFAPYIGIDWQQLYGSTADLAQASGTSSSQVSLVIGVRAWY